MAQRPDSGAKLAGEEPSDAERRPRREISLRSAEDEEASSGVMRESFGAGVGHLGKELSNGAATPRSINTPSNPLTPSATTSRIAVGEISEFQLYQKFRLKMVQGFGSLASALYEFGADPDTGRLTRKEFEGICVSRLNLLSEDEACILFSHITNADPMELGLGGFCSYRDFGIKQEDWESVVRQKRGLDGGGMPFSSGAAGGSLGVYHRPIQLDNVHIDGQLRMEGSQHQLSRENSSSDDVEVSPGGEVTPRSGFKRSTTTKPSTREAAMKSSLRETRQKWRQRQKPWAPSMFLEQNFTDKEASVREHRKSFEAKRGRAGELTFRSKGAVLRPCPDPMKCAQLGSPCRTQVMGERTDMGFLDTACPPRRHEMVDLAAHTQVDAWWPHRTPRRTKVELTPRRARLPHVVAG